MKNNLMKMLNPLKNIFLWYPYQFKIKPMKIQMFIFFFVMNLCNGNAKTVTVSFNTNVKNYTLVLNSIAEQFFNSNDSELIILIEPGKYPILSRAHFQYYGEQPKKISIIGQTKNGEKATLYFPKSVVKPTGFIFFEGTLMKPINLEISLDNLCFIGNNVPYSSNHPFFGDKAPPENCLVLSNLKTITIKNCIIQNFYGNGIIAGNSYPENDKKKFMMQSPLIQNVKIINTWSENHKWNSGNGITVGNVLNPRILNCEIRNDLMYSKYYGFVGIDLEIRVEGAIVKNNIIEGYHTLLHDECNYGGHIISNNIFKSSLIGVNISEDCNQDIKKKYLYKPITIDGNSFYYNNEYKAINQGPGDWGFIAIYKPSFTIEGLRITNNKFKVGSSKSKINITPDKVLSDKKVYIALSAQKGVIMKNNSYE